MYIIWCCLRCGVYPSFVDHFPKVFLQVFPHRKPPRSHLAPGTTLSAGTTSQLATPGPMEATHAGAEPGRARRCAKTILIHTYPQTEIATGEKYLQIISIFARDCNLINLMELLITLRLHISIGSCWNIAILLSNYLGSCHGDTLRHWSGMMNVSADQPFQYSHNHPKWVVFPFGY